MEENKRIIAVTGGSGHIGQALLRLLKEKGETVRSLCTRENGIKELEPYSAEVVMGNVTDYDSLVAAFTGAEVVVHLAGVITIGGENKKLVRRVNVEGTKNVVNACVHCGVKTLIYVSTVHAVDFLSKKEMIQEKPLLNSKRVKGIYAKTKAEATNIVIQANSPSLKTVAVMPSGVIGPYATSRSNFAQFILDYANKKLRMRIKGEYNFVDVRDVADGIYSAIDLGRGGESYLLTGEKMSVEKMMGVISSACGVKVPKIKVPLLLVKIAAPIAELIYRIRGVKPLFTPLSIYTLNSNPNFDNSKAKNELNFNPRQAEKSLIEEYECLFSSNSKTII